MIGRCDQITGVGEAVGRRLGIGNARRVHAKVAQIPAVQRLLDGDGSQCRLGKGLHRRRIRGLGRRDRERARELAEIDRVLDDVGLKAVAAEQAGREFGVEREAVDRLPQRRRALPSFIRIRIHRDYHFDCSRKYSLTARNG
jgi:hypothetical protein